MNKIWKLQKICICISKDWQYVKLYIHGKRFNGNISLNFSIKYTQEIKKDAVI